MKSGTRSGSRWGIKGVEDLGNGYSVGFILEQGFNSDDGSVGISGKTKRAKKLMALSTVNPNFMFRVASVRSVSAI